MRWHVKPLLSGATVFLSILAVGGHGATALQITRQPADVYVLAGDLESLSG